MAILNCFVRSVFTEHREDLFPQPRAAALHKDFFARQRTACFAR